jgi:uncharacterized protein YndB with AHSA1/START domain
MSWAIDAPSARIWETLTAPSELPHWLGKVVGGAVSPGSSFVIDHGDGYVCESVVAEYSLYRTLAYSWKFPDEPRSDVSWTLSPGDSGVAIHLAHTGLRALVPAYRDGWMAHLTFLEASALWTPLPVSMFWQLHATIAHLNAPR